MYISLVTWERSSILERSLTSLAACNFPPDSHIVITDDKSSNPKVLESIHTFKDKVKDKVDIEIRIREKRLQSWVNNVDNMKYCFSKTKDDHIICLESDGLYNKNFLFKFVEFKASCEKNVQIGMLSLFHYDRLKTIGEHNSFLKEKEAVGAFCTMFHRRVIHGLAVKRGFDWAAIELCKRIGLKILCSKQSYAQHIGIGQESMNSPEHMNVVAKDFVGEN